VSLFYRSADRLVVHSTAAELAVKKMAPSSVILNVPHGEYALFNTRNLEKTEARKRLGGIEDDEFVFLFFGHLDLRKGLQEFLGAARRLEHRRMKFVVAGRNDLGPLGQQVLLDARGGVARMDVGRVPFEAVQDYFAACDVVVLPYREGSTSGVLKIAMAFGRPVIATDVGDFPETLIDWPGILISHDAIEDTLVAAAEEIFDRYDEFFARIGDVRDKYKWTNIARSYHDFLVAD
jgi:glycosyltransferase involved in cell wall biosynthesis